MLAIAAAAMLAVPVTSASWSAMGSIEPDNKYESATFNYQTVPGAATNRIYLQAFETIFGLNPNVGAAGTVETHTESFGATNVYAILGVWRDCNGDGYIGLAESATLEYPSQLLSSTAICPPATGSQTNPNAYKNAGYPSNWNGWVTEFIHIGGNASDPEDDLTDARIIRDSSAMVWGDFGLPTDSADAAGGTCALTPLPRGTLQSTGGALNYFNCLTGVGGHYNNVFEGRRLVGQDAPGADPSNSLGLMFENDEDLTDGDHPLDVGTFGPEDSSGAAVSTTDCSTNLVRSGDVINGTGIEDTTGPLDPSAHNVVVYQPSPAVMGGTSIPGQVNQTNEEFDDCDTSNDRGDDFYGIAEGDFEGSTQGTNVGKIQAEWNFGFNDFARGDVPWRLLAGQAGADPAGPADFAGGFRAIGLVFFAGAIWDGNSGLVKAPTTIRTGQLVNEGSPEPDSAWLETIYAYVGPSTTTQGFVLPGGGITAKYGQAQCGAFTSGVHNGWQCDPSKWNINSGTGDPVPEPTDSAANARVGQLYNLRDIDCYDGTILAANVPVPAGAGALSDSPCN